MAEEAAGRVAKFRRRTKEHLEVIDELAAMEDVDMGELFTDNFYEKVENQREEWITALEDLERRSTLMRPRQTSPWKRTCTTYLTTTRTISSGVRTLRVTAFSI